MPALIFDQIIINLQEGDDSDVKNVFNSNESGKSEESV